MSFFQLMDPIYCCHPDLAPDDAPPEFIKEWKEVKESMKEAVE